MAVKEISPASLRDASIRLRWLICTEAFGELSTRAAETHSATTDVKGMLQQDETKLEQFYLYVLYKFECFDYMHLYSVVGFGADPTNFLFQLDNGTQ